MHIKIKGKLLNLKKCESLFSQLICLMFKFKLKEDGLFFVFGKEKIVFLHMFFVFFPIDVICFDSNKNIVKIIKDVKPFTPLLKCYKCKYIIEVKSGLVRF